MPKEVNHEELEELIKRNYEIGHPLMIWTEQVSAFLE